VRPDEETVDFDIDGPVKAETDKALLVVIEGDEVWMPKSQIAEHSEVQHEGDSGTITVTLWIATEKGLA
jgi:hypothetical protein